MQSNFEVAPVLRRLLGSAHFFDAVSVGCLIKSPLAFVVWTTGWAGRYLDGEFPGFPAGCPSAQNPDPLAISIGSVVSNCVQDPTLNMGMAFRRRRAGPRICRRSYPAAGQNALATSSK